MMVPSRSTKTAGDSSSVMVAIFSEAGDKFISRHGCSSKFANHNCASVVGDFCRFNWSCSADKPESKERNGSIGRAGDRHRAAGPHPDRARECQLREKLLRGSG